MIKEIIASSHAPQAIGTYSQAIKVGDTLYCSGQIALDFKTMQLCSDIISEQIHQVFKNLAAVLEAAGGTFENIVKLSVFMVDLQHFHLVNEIMALYFSQPYPARAVIGVAALPKDAQVEMEAIAVF